MSVALYMGSGDRRCYLLPGQAEHIYCRFEIDGIRLARATFPDRDVAARAVNLWLDQKLTLDDLSWEFTISVLTRRAELLERGEKTRWSWLNLLDRCRSEPYFARHVPLLERLMEVPEISRFTPHTSMNRIRFLRCEYAAASLDGMPVVTPTQTGFMAVCDDDRIEGDIEVIVPFVVRRLERIPDPPCAGCAGVVLLEPINACLAERGSALRAQRSQAWHRCHVAAGNGNRICAFETTNRADEPYKVIFSNEVSSEACGFFKAIPDVVTAAQMWLEQNYDPEDIAAVADRNFEVY